MNDFRTHNAYAAFGVRKMPFHRLVTCARRQRAAIPFATLAVNARDGHALVDACEFEIARRMGAEVENYRDDSKLLA